MNDLITNPLESLLTRDSEDKLTVSLDSQWMNAIQGCMQMMKYSLIDRLRPSRTPEPLDRGSLLHHILDHYYKGRMANKKHEDNVEEAIAEGLFKSSTLDLDTENSQEVIKVARENLNYHRNDGWVPVAVEEPFSYVLYEDDTIKIVSTGVIDLVAKVPGINELVVADHKSSKRASNPFMLSNQFMNYSYATKVKRFVVNQIGFQKTVPAEQKFRRLIFSYNETLLEEWKKNTVFWVKLAARCIESDTYPKNLTHCDKYAGCIYQKLCSALPEVREWKATVDFVKAPVWDPYTKD